MDLSFLTEEMVGRKVPKPISGTLSGHAAGEPFDKLVEILLRERFGHKIKRQFAYLNELFSANPKSTTFDDRKNLISSEVARFLLMRGRKAVKNWSINNLFKEKQNDTADILLIDGFPASKFHIVDVKTTNISKKAQAPNIISAEKLAKACALMLDTNDFDTIKFSYIGVYWKLEEEMLICQSVAIVELFKTDPNKIYINWAAAMQIQFKVNELSQSFEGDTKAWCENYIKKYVESYKDYTAKKLKKFNSFDKYIK